MVTAAFVAPFLLEATARFIRSAAELPGVRVVITSTPADQLPNGLADLLAGTGGSTMPRSAADRRRRRGAVRAGRPVDRLVGALEHLQEPLAVARQMLGVDGMDVRTARNVRDKAQMKSVLRAAGVPCARHQLVHHPFEAVAFADEVGFPLVAKPPGRVRRRNPARRAVGAAGVAASDPPARGLAALLEEFLVGEEHTFDSVTINGQTVWASIADYIPPPLEVLRTPWIQWVVMLPETSAGRSTPASTRSDGRPARRSRRPYAHGVVPSSGRLVAVSEVAARPPGLSSRRCMGTRTAWTCTAPGPSWSSSAGSNRDRVSTRPGRCICAAWAGAGSGPSTGPRPVQRELGD